MIFDTCCFLFLKLGNNTFIGKRGRNNWMGKLINNKTKEKAQTLSHKAASSSKPPPKSNRSFETLEFERNFSPCASLCPWERSRLLYHLFLEVFFNPEVQKVIGFGFVIVEVGGCLSLLWNVYICQKQPLKNWKMETRISSFPILIMFFVSSTSFAGLW